MGKTHVRRKDPRLSLLSRRPSGVADHDGMVRYRSNHHTTCSNNAISPDVRHHHSAFTDPRPFADRHWHKSGRMLYGSLHADMLMSAARDRNSTGDLYVVADGRASNDAVGADE